MDGPSMISQKTLQESEFEIFRKFDGEGLDYSRLPGSPPLGRPEFKPSFLSRSAAELVHNKKSANFRAWLHTALQPLVAYRLDTMTTSNYGKVPDELKLKLEWVYGIRCQDTKRALQYTVGRQQAESVGTRNKYEKSMQEYGKEIIYYVSNTVILLNLQLSQQRFYTEHTQEIISMAVSNATGDYVATGEYSSIKPSVHIWNCRTLENINVLQGVHHRGVHLLAFSNDDRFLITCGLMNPSAILIFDWHAGTVIVSSSIAAPTQDIVVLQGRNSAQFAPQ